MKEHGLPSSGVWLQNRALSIAADMEITDFKASNQWFMNFEFRFQLSTQTISGEAAKVDSADVASWLEKNRAKLSSYAPDDVSNCDGTALLPACSSMKLPRLR